MDFVATTITNSENVKTVLLKQVEGIAAELLKKENVAAEPGLLGGSGGIILFFAYLEKIFPGKYSNELFDMLSDLGDSLSNDEFSDWHLSAGIAGVGFVFQHLRNIGILDNSVDLNLSELDEFINLGIDYDYKNGNWDPLHGMVGTGLYFLERCKETGEKKYLEKIVDYLFLMRKQVDKYTVWITPGYGKYSKDNYNFGIAHGMTGVLSFFAQVYAAGVRQDQIEEMISSCLSFLLQNEYPEDSIYSFPNAIDVVKIEDQQPNSRLAWCYGDLCMTNALIHCGKALHRSDWISKGIEVAIKTTRRNMENAGCLDAPFCHGSAGIAHQYNRLFQLTSKEVFKNSCQYWINITLDQYYKPGQGAAGYFFRSMNEETESVEYNPQYGLLEGCTGIALVFLSLAYDVKSDWDAIFMTNV